MEKNMKEFKTIWKDLSKNKKIESVHFVDRAILIAMNSKSNMPREDIVHILLDKYFSPITNKTKLINGSYRYHSLAIDTGYFNKKCSNQKIGTVWRQWLKIDANILGIPYLEFFDNEEEIEHYVKLFNSIILDKINRKYVYYFTRQDIEPVHQSVQAAHVVFKLGSHLGENVNPDETFFQWVGVPDRGELQRILHNYKDLGAIGFYEPDMQNTLTSVAIPPLLWYKRGELVNHKLLSFNH
jgi:hypothetical protein